MAEQYQSNYTGEQIDGGIAKANTAIQPSALQAALASYQELLQSGVNIKTINNNSILGAGNIEIQGGSDIAIKELDFTNSSDFDQGTGEPTQEAMLDIIANKYIFIHIYNIPVNEDINVETYLIANNMANLENENNIRYYYKFDEGDEDEGTVPNIEQYKFSIEDGQAQLVVENYNLGGDVADSIGDMSNLTTTEKSTLVGAINELVTRIEALENTNGGE